MSISLIALLAVNVVNAQNGFTLVGSGYGLPSIPVISPGQIVKFHVAGLPLLSDGGYFQLKATRLPLPLNLAGISVSISQDMSNGDIKTFNAPLLSVEQTASCFELVPECYLTLLTIQIPFELIPFSRPGTIPPSTFIVIRQNDTMSNPFLLFVSPDGIHIVNTCDFIQVTVVNPDLSSLCRSVVTHADGSPVVSTSPASPGETVVVYAFGLGQTTPLVKTGEAAPTPAPVLSSSRIYLDFDFRPNASPSRPLPPLFGQATAPVFVGLTPGEVGLYQINVQLPDKLPAKFACGGVVQSNLTVNFAGAFSFDGAQICVSGDDLGR